jgi:hypothetical protein
MLVMVALRGFFSLQHLKAAALFTRKSHEIERKYAGYDEGLISEHRIYVTGALFFVVAFLEATVNELYSDAGEPTGGILAPLNKEKVKELNRAWTETSGRKTVRFAPLLKKYQTALVLTGVEEMDLGRRPAQDVSTIIEIRDYLVHYKPEWISAELQHKDPNTVSYDWASALRGRFPLNPLMGGGSPFFPMQVLSHGCASWAVTEALTFLDQFYGKLGVSGRHMAVAKQIKLSVIDD